jgi:hypothetical protein
MKYTVGYACQFGLQGSASEYEREQRISSKYFTFKERKYCGHVDTLPYSPSNKKSQTGKR